MLEQLESWVECLYQVPFHKVESNSFTDCSFTKLSQMPLPSTLSQSWVKCLCQMPLPSVLSQSWVECLCPMSLPSALFTKLSRMPLTDCRVPFNQVPFNRMPLPSALSQSWTKCLWPSVDCFLTECPVTKFNWVTKCPLT